MDETAFNYDVDANTDDGSCIATVYGCTDETAFNYNSLANTDDGTCVEVVEGCMEDWADNYNPLANDNGGEYQIGDLYQGGLLFQINEDGTGFVVDTINLESGNWYDAPGVASNSTSGGYNDWFSSWHLSISSHI